MAEVINLKKNRELDMKKIPDDCLFIVGACSDKNAPRRRKMEDGHCYFYNFNGIKNQGFFGVFDGHAGAGASKYCQAHFHEALMQVLSENQKIKDNGEESLHMQECLAKTFELVDSQIINEENKIHSGCTAAVSLFKPTPGKDNIGKLYSANVGDSRVVLCRNGKAARLTHDHKGSDPQEANRIANAGGFVIHERVSGVLAVTRALGDEDLKEFVSGKPYTTKLSVTAADEFLILACDGLWDVCTDQTAVDLVRELADPLKASEFLVDYAIDQGSADNLTVMVVRFRPMLNSTVSLISM